MMSQPVMSRASKAYGHVHRATQVDGASPHALTRLLFENALSRISVARHLIEHGDGVGLHRCIDKTLAVVNELQGSLLDHESNAMSAQLYDLYNFVTDQLLFANRTQDMNALTNAAQVLGTLLEAWNGISSAGAVE